MKDTGSADSVGATDNKAVDACHLLARTEGIRAALESSHAIAQDIKLARDMPKDAIVLCNLSGRGDKDVEMPAKLVENEARSMLQQAVEQARRQGQKAEAPENGHEGFMDAARKRVLVGLVVGEVARRNELRLDQIGRAHV